MEQKDQPLKTQDRSANWKQGKKRKRSTQQKRRSSPKKGVKEEEIIVPLLQEPKPICQLCNEVITSIAHSFSGSEEGSYIHFDCMLKKVEEDEKVQPPQKVSYIGSGSFAIVEKDESGKFSVVKQIQVESPEKFQAMKQFVEENKR